MTLLFIGIVIFIFAGVQKEILYRGFNDSVIENVWQMLLGEDGEKNG